MTALGPPIPAGAEPAPRGGSGPPASSGRGGDAGGAPVGAALFREPRVDEGCARRRGDASSPPGSSACLGGWERGLRAMEQPEPGKPLSFRYSPLAELVPLGVAANDPSGASSAPSQASRAPFLGHLLPILRPPKSRLPGASSRLPLTPSVAARSQPSPGDKSEAQNVSGQRDSR